MADNIRIDVSITVAESGLDDVMLAMHNGTFEYGPGMGEATLRRVFRDPTDVVTVMQFIADRRTRTTAPHPLQEDLHG